MPEQSPSERQKEFERIAARRKAMLDAEEALRAKRASEKESFVERGHAAYQEEIAAAQQRSEEREEWRQERHQKIAAEKVEKERKETERRELAAQEEKKAAFQAEQKKQMEEFHDAAVQKRLAASRKSIEQEEHEAEKHIEELTGRDGRALDEELRRTLTAISRDMQKKEQQFAADIARRRKMLEDSFDHAKRALAHQEQHATSEREKLAAGHERMQLISEHNHQLLRLEKEEEAHALKIKQERTSLENEARTKASQKQHLVRDEHDRRLREALQRKDTALEWIGMNDPNEKGK